MRLRERTSRVVTAIRKAPRAIPRTIGWSVQATSSTRRMIDAGRVPSNALAAPPPAPIEAEVFVNGVLLAMRATCLTRAVVRQTWLAEQGSEHDLVVGVTKPSSGFRAHAWLDGDPPWSYAGYSEILRRKPREDLVPPSGPTVWE